MPKDATQRSTATTTICRHEFGRIFRARQADLNPRRTRAAKLFTARLSDKCMAELGCLRMLKNPATLAIFFLIHETQSFVPRPTVFRRFRYRALQGLGFRLQNPHKKLTTNLTPHPSPVITLPCASICVTRCISAFKPFQICLSL